MNVTEIIEYLDTGRPSQEKWERVLAWFDELPPSQHKQATSAIDPKLDTLPDDIRRAPPRWVRDAINGAPAHRLRLARSIHLRARDARHRGSAIGDHDMQDFVAIAELKSIHRLKLFFCGLSDTGATLLASCRHLSNLKFLNLAHNNLTYVGALAILNSGNLRQLTKLHLSRNRIGDRGAKKIAACSKAARLDVLALRDCGLTAEGIRLLEQSPHLAGCSLHL